MPLNLALRTDSLCLRGTDQAIFDYYQGLTKRGYDCTIWVGENNNNTISEGVNRMEGLNVRFYQHPNEIKADLIYSIEDGTPIGDHYNVSHVVHGVFNAKWQLGKRTVAISQWLAERDGCEWFVPHIVQDQPKAGDLRKELGIPEEALVIGRYGGMDSFDIPFVETAILSTLNHRNLYYIFANTPQFTSNQRIKWLTPVWGERKSEFINTCDVFLHARNRGETFGLAIAEFSHAGKHILTYSDSKEKAHIEHLKNRSHQLYSNYEDLRDIIDELVKTGAPKNNVPWVEFSEEKVIDKFEEVFFFN